MKPSLHALTVVADRMDLCQLLGANCTGPSLKGLKTFTVCSSDDKLLQEANERLSKHDGVAIRCFLATQAQVQRGEIDVIDAFSDEPAFNEKSLIMYTPPAVRSIWANMVSPIERTSNLWTQIDTSKVESEFLEFVATSCVCSKILELKPRLTLATLRGSCVVASKMMRSDASAKEGQQIICTPEVRLLAFS